MVETDWRGLYGESWTGIIAPEAFSHPAKYSRGLIRHIYQHAVDEGWLQEGDTVLDPFGGVALGAWPCLRMGINWVALELEEKFVALGNQNIDLWNSRYKGRLPKWGNAVLLQGDSRELAEVLKGAGFAGMISSPPYIGAISSQGHGLDLSKSPVGHDRTKHKNVSLEGLGGDYGSHPAQLGNMREGELGEVLADVVISSPPYAQLGTKTGKVDETAWSDGRPRPIGASQKESPGYGQSEGQLAAMPAGDAPVACISSPPHGDSIREGKSGIDWGKQADRDTDHSHGYDGEGYGSTPGNLAQLPVGDAPVACISSPPFEKAQTGGGIAAAMQGRSDYQVDKHLLTTGSRVQGYQTQGETEGQLGQESGDTFWSATKAIVQQVYQVLAPGGHCVWITKRFVRNKAIVEFSQQWRDMCESVGFVTAHWHRAWLVEDRGTQHRLDGGIDKREVRRMSFFRRLHTKKYPHLAILWEDVICQVKP